MAEQVTQLLPVDDGVPKWAGIYRLNEEWLRPELSASFPAHLLESPLEWRDLVLDTGVMAQIEELHAWLKYGHTLMDAEASATKGARLKCFLSGKDQIQIARNTKINIKDTNKPVLSFQR